MKVSITHCGRPPIASSRHSCRSSHALNSRQHHVAEQSACLGLHNSILQALIDCHCLVGRDGPTSGRPDGHCCAFQMLPDALRHSVTCAPQHESHSACLRCCTCLPVDRQTLQHNSSAHKHAGGLLKSWQLTAVPRGPIEQSIGCVGLIQMLRMDPAALQAHHTSCEGRSAIAQIST